MGVIAFADDLVLLSEQEYDMKKLMEITENFFDERKLSVNVKKCLSFRALPVAKSQNKKILKVLTEEHRMWKESFILSMNFEQLAKYLGVKFNHRGEVQLPWKEWDEWLSNLSKSPLKPHQKI